MDTNSWCHISLLTCTLQYWTQRCCVKIHNSLNLTRSDYFPMQTQKQHLHWLWIRFSIFKENTQVLSWPVLDTILFVSNIDQNRFLWTRTPMSGVTFHYWLVHCNIGHRGVVSRYTTLIWQGVIIFPMQTQKQHLDWLWIRFSISKENTLASLLCVSGTQKDQCLAWREKDSHVRITCWKNNIMSIFY